MNFTETNVENQDLAKVVSFNFTKDEFNKIYNAKLRQFASDKKFKLSGFRPGKIPLSVIEQYRGKEAQHEAISKLRENAIQEYAKNSESNIAAILDTEVSFNQANSSEFTTLKITLEFFPKFELKDLSEVKIFEPEINIEEAIEDLVLALRKQQSTFSDVDRPVQMEDLVVISSVAKDKNNEEFALLTFDEDSLVIGDNKLPEEYTTNLIGATIGETVEFDINNETFKDIKVTVVVKKVQVMNLPDVNEEFVQLFLQRKGDINILKEEIRKNVIREAEINSTKYMYPQVRAELIKLYSDIPLPEQVVKAKADEMYNELAKLSNNTGEELSKELEDFKEACQKQARDVVLFDLIIKELSEAYDIKVNYDEVSEFIDKIAVMYEYPEGFKEEVKKSNEQMQLYLKEVFLNKFVTEVNKHCKLEKVPMTYLNLVKAVSGQRF